MNLFHSERRVAWVNLKTCAEHGLTNELSCPSNRKHVRQNGDNHTKLGSSRDRFINNVQFVKKKGYSFIITGSLLNGVYVNFKTPQIIRH